MTTIPISPLAPESFPELPPVAGVRLATRAATIRYKGRDDVMIAVVEPGTTVAGVFTRSMCPSAPVDWSRRALVDSGGVARAVVCNSGNANAFTGAAGEAVAAHTAEAVAALLGCRPSEVHLASTGVIGEVLPEDRLVGALAPGVASLRASDPSSWQAAADAIRTTDTFAKGSSAAIAGTDANVVGIAKGSGMIAPDMATMLAFVFTDLVVSAPLLQRCLSAAVGDTFNRITVDSDTSTSDTVLLLATAASGDAPIATVDDPRLPALQAALDVVCLDLSRQIVRDGEGATKFVTVCVRGAADDDAAATIAFAIANSPLVKTALAASDANWGRVVMAVGKSGQAADRDSLAIWIGDEQCAEAGVQKPGYSEARATAHLEQAEVEITVDVGIGSGTATVWTCDLTHGYIDINAGYRS